MRVRDPPPVAARHTRVKRDGGGVRSSPARRGGRQGGRGVPSKPELGPPHPARWGAARGSGPRGPRGRAPRPPRARVLRELRGKATAARAMMPGAA